MQQKYLIIIIAALAISFGVYVYLVPPGSGDSPVAPAAGDTATIVIHSPDSLISCVECNTETVGQPIDHFKYALQSYRANIWDSVNRYTFGIDTKGKNFTALETLYPQSDARSLWFSMESLKQFICSIEKNNAQLHQPAEKLGIRFYYGVYEDNYPELNKQKRHTLFMVPTYNNGGNDEIDFDPRETLARQRDTVEFGHKYDTLKVTIAELLGVPTSTPYLILGEKEPNPPPKGKSTPTSPGLIRNNGEMCPVNCSSVNTLHQIDN